MREDRDVDEDDEGQQQQNKKKKSDDNWWQRRRGRRRRWLNGWKLEIAARMNPFSLWVSLISSDANPNPNANPLHARADARVLGWG